MELLWALALAVELGPMMAELLVPLLVDRKVQLLVELWACQTALQLVCVMVDQSAPWLVLLSAAQLGFWWEPW
jgi:hypothetical protein